MASLPPEVLYGPAYAPPDNTIPNFDDPPNQNVLGLTVIVLCLTFATLCAIFRAYSRIVVVKKIHIEDCMIYLLFLIPDQLKSGLLMLLI